jgi:hypothetical protein
MKTNEFVGPSVRAAFSGTQTVAKVVTVCVILATIGIFSGSIQ